MKAGRVLMIYRSAKAYNERINDIREMGGFTFLSVKDRFNHVVEIKDVELELFLDLNAWSNLEKVIRGRERFDWVICKDFHPDDMEIALFKSRLLPEGALSCGDLFIFGPESISTKLRWWQ